jgi:hypothetical protein
LIVPRNNGFIGAWFQRLELSVAQLCETRLFENGGLQLAWKTARIELRLRRLEIVTLQRGGSWDFPRADRNVRIVQRKRWTRVVDGSGLGARGRN